MLLFCNQGQVAAMAALHAKCFVGDERWSADFFRRQLQNPQVLGLVDWEGAGPIALALLQRAGDAADILTIATDPAWRRRGRGRAILSALVGLVPPPATLWLEVAATNQAAIGLYQAVGFSMGPTRKNYYGAGNDAKQFFLKKT